MEVGAWRLLPGGEDVHVHGCPLCMEHHIIISSSVISQHHTSTSVCVGVTRINQNSQQLLRVAYLRCCAA